MKHLFDLHPAAVAGELLGGRREAGQAQQDAEPERDTVPADSRRRLPGALLALRRRREATASARSANA